MEYVVSKKPTEFRMKRMRSGDVFLGLEKIKNKHQRALIEAERYNKFIDMLGSKPAVEARANPRPNPIEWVKGFARNHGVEYTKKKIEKILKDSFTADHPMQKPYIESERARKNKIFYQNALSYLKNNLEK